MQNEKRFYEQFKLKMDKFVHNVYKATRHFPKEEMFGLTSQLRRSSVSVVLNYIEGYARSNQKVEKNFLKISFGSLKESQYLIKFCYDEKFFSQEDYQVISAQADEIGALLWTIIKKQ